MKFASKRELLARIEEEHARFVELAESIPRRRWKEPGVWGDDWTVHDLLAHLTEWERMFLRWHREGLAGETPDLPAPGYKWNETPALNRAIRERHARRATAKVRAEFDASYGEILALARALPERDLLGKGRFAWTGRNALVTYLGANTVSHYRTATKILKRWLRGQR